MKEYHHHITREESQSVKNYTVFTKSVDRNPIAVSGRDTAQPTAVGEYAKFFGAEKASSGIPKAVKHGATANYSPKSKPNTKATSKEQELNNSKSQFEDIDKQLKKAQQQVVLSRSHRLSSRIGCNWRRGSSALKIEMKQSFSEKIINTARRANIWKGDVHPHIVLHDKVGETTAWIPKDKRQKDSISEVFGSGKIRP